MNSEFKCLGTEDLKDKLWCVFSRYKCLFKFSLSCLSTLHIQSRGPISKGVIALYLLIRGKRFAKATSRVERAIGFPFSRVDGKAARTKSPHSFWMWHIWEFGEHSRWCWSTAFLVRKHSIELWLQRTDYQAPKHHGPEIYSNGTSVSLPARRCQWFSQGSMQEPWEDSKPL